MTLQVEIKKRDNFLYAVLSGDFNLGQIKDIFKEILEENYRHNLSRILIDARKMTGSISTMARYNMATWAVLHMRSLVKVAWLGRRDQMYKDRFAENVAINRGARVKVTTDMEEAFQWLNACSDSADKIPMEK